MLDFEKMNLMVANRESPPDDLCLAETVTWQGLQYVYTLLAMGRYSKADCTAIKMQIGREYQEHVERFEKMERDMESAIALFQMAKKSSDKSVRMLLDSVMQEDGHV